MTMHVGRPTTTGGWLLRDLSGRSLARLPDETFSDPKAADDRTRSAEWVSRPWVIVGPSGVVRAAAANRTAAPQRSEVAELLVRARAALAGDSGDADADVLVDCIDVIERMSDGDWAKLSRELHAAETERDRLRAEVRALRDATP